jgi:RimJ/RimL family protein N-acetyltransferase
MIETEQTYLRPLERKDLPQRAEWLNHPAVRETLLLRFPVSLAETEQWFERILQDPTRQDFVICLKKTGELIGFVGWVNIDWVHRKAEPSLAIGRPDFWGQGIGTEVVHKLLDYGFNELGLNRQYVHILDFNVRSLNLFLHLGFKQEGVLKQDVIIHGEYHDRIILGITREAFDAGRAAEESSPGIGVKPSQQRSEGENPPQE